MNKILVSDIINLENGEYDIQPESNQLTLNIKSRVTIYIINEKLNKLDINLKDNSNLNLFLYNKNIQDTLLVNINEFNNTKINFNASVINNCNFSMEINNTLKGNDNESNINIRNISKNGNSMIKINVYIDEKTVNNIALEDLKGINNGGFIHIEPNIICKSNEVNANHLTTIGSISKDLLDYLMSKGLNKENATNLILAGFQYSNMDNYIKEKNGGE